jgi:hypothetical protein
MAGQGHFQESSRRYSFTDNRSGTAVLLSSSPSANLHPNLSGQCELIQSADGLARAAKSQYRDRLAVFLRLGAPPF